MKASGCLGKNGNTGILFHERCGELPDRYRRATGMKDDKLIIAATAAAASRTPRTGQTLLPVPTVPFSFQPVYFINSVKEDFCYALHGYVSLMAETVVGHHQLLPLF